MVDKLLGKMTKELAKKGEETAPLKSAKIKLKFDTKKKELAKKSK